MIARRWPASLVRQEGTHTKQTPVLVPLFSCRDSVRDAREVHSSIFECLNTVLFSKFDVIHLHHYHRHFVFHTALHQYRRKKYLVQRHLQYRRQSLFQYSHHTSYIYLADFFLCEILFMSTLGPVSQSLIIETGATVSINYISPLHKVGYDPVTHAHHCLHGFRLPWTNVWNLSSLS